METIVVGIIVLTGISAMLFIALLFALLGAAAISGPVDKDNNG